MQARALSTRNLATAFVLGQQGNINGEYWIGDVAEIQVYNQALTNRQLEHVSNALAARYDLPRHVPTRDPDQLALESLCHVLLNSNEFVYVD